MKPMRKLTPICTLHYVKLVYRSLLLILTVVMYLIHRADDTSDLFNGFERKHWALAVIWLVYAAEMACRFFPSKQESMGCGKQFKRNYIATGQTEPRLQSRKRTLAVVLAWVALNGVIGLLYYLRVIDKGILILVSLTYGVCDMICILFSCPLDLVHEKQMLHRLPHL